MILLASGTGLAQAATGGGGSSSGGSGGGLLASASTVMIAQDGFNGFGQPTLQGRGQASIDFFWNKTVSEFQVQLGRTPGTQGVQAGQTPRDSFNAVCGDALQNAADRATAMGHAATAADSRVVGIYFSYATGTTNWWVAGVPATEYSGNFAPSWDQEVHNPAAPGFAYDNDRAAYAKFEQDGVPALDAIAATWRTHVDAVIAATPYSGRYFTCVALNEFEPQADFQPVVSSQVSTSTLAKGEVLTDQVTVGAAAGDQWAATGGQPITVVARGTLYGPLSHAQATSPTVPPGTPVAATGTVNFAGPGTQPFSWTATASGTYAWVWEVRKADQGANAQYIRADAKDAYFAASETFTVRMSPRISTQVTSRYSDDPSFLAPDQVTVSLDEGDVWLADAAGNPYSLQARVDAYGCTNAPTAARATVPAGATLLGTKFVTFTAAGTKTVTQFARTCAGAVTYVVSILRSDQSAEVATILSGDVVDSYMLEPETTIARATIGHYSEVREYNVAMGGRIFDTITISGVQADHGTWPGVGGWQADVATSTVTTYYSPTGFTSATVLPADAETVKTTTIPAHTGTYNIGYTASDMIQANKAGHYVVQYCFAGDARLAPYCSSLTDIREQAYVPKDGASWIDLMSTATPNATAGVGTIADLVLVTGNSIPAGATMTWQTCTWTDPSAPGCAQPTNTYSTAVSGSGFYNHPELPTPKLEDFPPGVLDLYYGWAPVLTDAAGVVLDRETFGTPSQVTHIRASVPQWSSQATATAKLGDTLTDTVTFDGPTRSDWTVQWIGCYLDAADVCAAGSEFPLTDPVHVDPSSPDLTAPGFKLDEVPASTAPGTKLRLGWQPVLVDGIGAELRREPWGAAGQVTIIDYPLPSMTSTATASAPLGQISKDAVTITGPSRGGSRLIWSPCYWIEHAGDASEEAASRECRQDATPVADVPVLEDGSIGLVLPALAVGETITVQSPEHKLTAGGLLPDPGLRFTWTPRLADVDGKVLVQEQAGVAAQTTIVEFPPVTAVTTAYSSSPDGPWYGDGLGDRVTTTGDVFAGDTVTVRLYAWSTGSAPVCEGEPLAQKVIELDASTSTYDTGLIYTTAADRTDLTYGFQETTHSRGTDVVSACGVAAETVTPRVNPAGSANGGASANLAQTGVRNVAALFALAALLAFVGGSLTRAREKHMKKVRA